CGPSEGIEGDPSFVPAPCDGKGAATYLDGLEPASPADGMLLTTEYFDSPIQTLEEAGTPCSGASDTHYCQIALTQSSLLSFVLGTYGQLPLRAQLRATRGDDVEILTSYDDLREFLAPVNTPAEAVLLASEG